MPILTASERIGTTIGGRYELRRLIGEGGFSTVFEGVHSVTGRDVAVKLLHSHLTATEQIAERFLMEARAMARIKHDGIVQVLDAGTDPDGSVFIALELLDGESLESTLLRVKQLTWGEATAICIDVLDALAEAHKHKIVHRDIKPGNIFIVRKPDGSSQAKLLDFGIAHVTQAKSKLTAAGMILGTPEYMSPEQGRSANVGPESDLWSVGIVMWECLTGHTPFVADSATEILLKIATTNAPSIVEEVPDLPPPIAAVIDKSLEREVVQRYRSADEMREAMQRAVRKVDEAASATVPPPRSPASRTMAPKPSQPRSESDERRIVGRPDVVNVDALPKIPLGSAPQGRVAPRVVSGDAGARAAATPNNLPIGERPAFRSGATKPRQSVSSPEIPAVSGSRAALAVSEQRAPAVPSARATGVMPAGSNLDDPEVGSRVASGESRRSTPSPQRSPLATDPGGAPRADPRVEPDDPEFALAARASSPRITPSSPRMQLDVDPRSAALRADTSTPASDFTPSGAMARPPGLTFDERESRSLSGQKKVFQKPPEVRRPPVGLMAAGAVSVALISAGVYLAVRGEAPRDLPVTPPRRVEPQHPPIATDAQVAEPPADLAARFTLVAINNVGLPQGLTGADNAAEFARHSAASYHAGNTQRMLATCIASPDGSTLYLHPMTPGALRGSSKGIVACAGYDLGLLPDITGDGSDDVVAVGARRNQLHLIDSRTLRPQRTIEVEGVRGIAVGAQVMVRGEPAIVVFTEPHGPGEPTEVQAVTALSSRVLWHIRGSGRIARVGHPIELGLAVGPDADGDEVGDVVAGLGPVVDSSDTTVEDRRCVQLFSGADGHPLWPQPFCQSRTRGSQSVSLGPDVNNDGKADVVVGTDQARRGEAPVVLLSGADGTVIRQLAAPPGSAGLGFGWPVALCGDLNGDRTPELLVGTVGSRTGVQIFDATTGRPVASVDLAGEGAGNLRLFPVPTLVPDTPWSVAVASPADGFHVYVRRDSEEPL